MIALLVLTPILLAGDLVATTHPTTVPVGQVIRVCVGQSDLYLNGKLTGMKWIRNAMNSVKPEARAQTVVEISAASAEVEAQRYDAQKEMINDWARDAALPTVKEVGVEEEPPDAEPTGGFFFLGGELPRPGAYALTHRAITLKQALIGAGVKPDGAGDFRLSMIRQAQPIIDAPLADLFEGKIEDLCLEPDDQIFVNHVKPGAATQPK